MRRTVKNIASRVGKWFDGRGEVVGRRPQVVIVGAGFAGLNAAKVLRDTPVEVTIVDRNNYHKFQPLLYQVATAGLEADSIAHNVRDIFGRHPNIRFRLATVTGVDVESRCVELHGGDRLSYDYLILAAGAVSNYFGIEGAREHGFPLKNVPDAIALRNHILRLFEFADREPDATREGVLNFVVVGGGPTGVETAGALTELFRVLQDDYAHLDTQQARTYLVEMLPQLLPGYAEAQGRYTRRVLEARGVEVLTETTVERVTAEAVHLKGGRSIPTRTLIWAAGVSASSLAGALGTEQVGGGRVRVASDLSVPGHPSIFVAGDMGAGESAEGEMYAQLAPVAIQQGRHAARQILRRIEGRPAESFHYVDLGKMATIGRNAAVAELPGGVRLNGFIAWLAWIFIHIAKLVGFRNRVNVFTDWVYNYFTYDRNARLIIDVLPVSEEVPLDAGRLSERIRKKLVEMEK